MKVIQSLNQNAALVARDDGAELVALGRGVGFGKKKGDTIDPSAVTRVFSLASSYRQEQLLGLIKELEPWVFELAQDITVIAEACLKKSLMDTFIFTIAKHLQYALDREPIEGGDYDPFQYQLHYLYPDEYQAAAEAIVQVNAKYQLRLAQEEVSFLTLHLVNGQIDQAGFHNVVELSEILNRLIQVIETKTGEPLDKESPDYGRFVVHIRYFLIRTLSHQTGQEAVSPEKIETVLETTAGVFPREWDLVKTLKETLQAEFNLSFGQDEDFYLLLHLVRILGRK